MKIILKVLFIPISLLGFWGIVELIELIPIFNDAKLEDLEGINRFLFLLWIIFNGTMGWLYATISWILGRKIFKQINKL